MKKKIIIWVFSVLILVTAIAFLAAAIDSYLYDMDPDNGVGGFVVLYELDLFYTVYYFFVKPKTTTKNLLNIFSNLSLALMLIYMLNTYGGNAIVPIVSFLLYILLRFVYGMIGCCQLDQAD